MTEDTTPLRFNLISEVALAEGETARPIHMLRTGTFTSMSGREFTFTPEHFAQMVANFKAGKRRKPPITENHDFGRAVGRLIDLWTDGDNLYGLPKWTKAGRDLVADEVYDGFSSEVNVIDSIIIGGSLTNYPAVDGLEPVTLSAPPLTQQGGSDPAVSLPSLTAPLALPSQARADTQPQPTQEHIAMSEEIQEAPALPPPPQISDAAMQAQISAYVGQMEARYQAQQEAAFQRAQAEFERRIADMEARRQIENFAQDATTATMQRQHALPFTAAELTALLAETPMSVRGKWQAALAKINDSGLVPFEEIGGAGAGDDSASSAEQWSALVNAKVALGMSRVNAIQAAMKERPELYAAQTKKGGR